VLANRVENAVAAARAEERAARQERITALVRDINRRLVEADTVGEIDRAVCEAFADSETYRFAWIGEPDAESGEVVPRASAGGADEYLDGATVRHDDAPCGRGPAGRAARAGDVRYAASVPDDETPDAWWTAVERHGVESAVAVPLSADAGLHDVLVVYAGTTDATSETERAVLAEIEMDGAVGVYQVDNLLKAKLRDSGLEDDVRIVAVNTSEGEGNIVERIEL
jgi:hypothetical protein